MENRVDVLIAEKYFGPAPETRPSWSHQTEGGWTSSFKGIFTHKTYPPNQVGYPDPWYDWIALPFSTDAAASKLLREKLAEKWNWQLRKTFNRFRFELAAPAKAYLKEGVDFFTEAADTEELAVVLCALKAAGCELGKSAGVEL